MSELTRFEKMIKRMLCNKVKTLYAKWVEEGRAMHAEFIRENFSECFQER